MRSFMNQRAVSFLMRGLPQTLRGLHQNWTAPILRLLGPDVLTPESFYQQMKLRSRGQNQIRMNRHPSRD